MAEIKIIDAGLLSTVQDLGRYGFQRYGVSVSGVMDEYSARAANFLVGNDKNSAVIESTMKGPAIEFQSPGIFAVTGADTKITLNGKEIDLWKSHKVQKGDQLKFDFCRKGVRNYIAFGGGIDVPVVMNSRATNLKGGFGGFKGRKLQAGDMIPLGESTLNISERKIMKNVIPDYPKSIEVGVLLGQQEDQFKAEGVETFFASEYVVSQENDRMGIRLTGGEIAHKEGADIISDGITFGAIQIPGNGNPIIMMADRQTTGGYTKIGNVITADLSKLAQVTAGTKVRFKRVELEEAVKKLKEFNGILDNLENHLEVTELGTGSVRVYKVIVNGKPFTVEIEKAEEREN